MNFKIITFSKEKKIKWPFGYKHVCVCVYVSLFCVGPVYYSRDLQVRISVNFSLKLSLTVLFTH